jgi:hypothetical protein
VVPAEVLLVARVQPQPVVGRLGPTTPVPVVVETLHLEITQPWEVRVDLVL